MLLFFPHIQTALYKKCIVMIYIELFKSTIFSFCEAVIKFVVVSFHCGRQESVFKGRNSEGTSLQQDAEGLPSVTMSPTLRVLPLPGDGHATFIPSHERMGCASANNSK